MVDSGRELGVLISRLRSLVCCCELLGVRKSRQNAVFGKACPKKFGAPSVSFKKGEKSWVEVIGTRLLARDITGLY